MASETESWGRTIATIVAVLALYFGLAVFRELTVEDKELEAALRTGALVVAILASAGILGLTLYRFTRTAREPAEALPRAHSSDPRVAQLQDEIAELRRQLEDIKRKSPEDSGHA